MLVTVVASACDSPPASGPPSVSDGGGATSDGGVGESYSIVVLPDTQYYASSWPQILEAQTRWLIENRDSQKIAFVLHTGDLVDSDVPAQWQVVSHSLHQLDGVLPYAVTAGNHDYLDLADRMGMGNVYFPPSGFAAFSWFGGTFEPGHIENSFSVMPAGAVPWVVVSLEFGPRDEVLAWADTVLESFADRPAIVFTHAYLNHDGSRYDHVRRPEQLFNPHDYVMMGQGGSSINDGEEIWRKLIVPNRNVKLVLCGHDVSGDDLPPGTTSRLTSARPDGSRVHQLLANYQTCTAPPCEASAQGTEVRGGGGYLRILRVSPATRTIAVSTYSPYLDRSLTDDSNQFVLPLE